MGTKTASKSRVMYRCGDCGSSAPQWSGRCPSCGEWNTLVEELMQHSPPPYAASRFETTHPVSLQVSRATQLEPWPTGIAELDRVLGGGLVPGSVTLLGGDPGIGKSTMILQLCASVGASGLSCLIATGEESVDQVGRRAMRLGADADNVMLLAENDLSRVFEVVESSKPDLLVVDSVQTTLLPGVGSAVGTVAQVRECAQALVQLAKRRNIAVVMVGHVTKEGSIAGPRVLEHVVDTVIEFEGDRHHGLRFLRAAKHRFGSTDEVGVLEMTESGLRSVPDASGMFLDDRQSGVPGSAVVPVLQGRRPMLVELQALVSETTLPQPRRLAQGIDSGRLAVVLAILGRRQKIWAGADDVYASAVGGVRVDEPAADLALALTLASAMHDIALPADLVAIGEVGLAGEVRKVGHVDKRLTEALRMGFGRALIPKGSPAAPDGMIGFEVSSLDEALKFVDLNKKRPPGRSQNTSKVREAAREPDE